MVVRIIHITTQLIQYTNLSNWMITVILLCFSFFKFILLFYQIAVKWKMLQIICSSVFSSHTFIQQSILSNFHRVIGFFTNSIDELVQCFNSRTTISNSVYSFVRENYVIWILSIFIYFNTFT